MDKSTVFQAPEVKEPILEENQQRFVLFPIKYHSIY